MSETYQLTSTVKLNDGNSMPRFGLGVYESEPGQECYNAVRWALEAGYRHIDGAEWYENEQDCGKAINDFLSANPSLQRSDIFFTSKLMHNQSDPQSVIDAIKVSLEKSKQDYLDLYLIHGPQGGPEVRAQSWEGCMRAKEMGLVKSIGVSNFGIQHLTDLLASQPRVIPSVNQVDLHPFMTRDDLVAYCEKNGIVLEAWGPLVRGQRFDHPEIVKMAQKYKKSPAQLLIRWGLERGFVVIPKSTKKNRIAENANVFDFQITKEDVDHLTSLDEFLITDWEVTTIP